ncbi:MAG: glycosyltransferase [Spirochaetaceae bacterium]|jgi:glycosyltransferase involved in cell wall biosynthesis|nr:glycosyltransferase [Spirochaetaceae bacterium]
MRIAIFTDAYWPRVNGVSVSIDAFSHALLRLGHKVLIVCSEYPESMDVGRLVREEADDAGPQPEIIQVSSFEFAISKEDRIAYAHKVFWVSRQVEAFAPDIIHLNSEFIIANFGSYCAKRLKLPVVYTLHTLWEEYGLQYFPVFPAPVVRFIAKCVFKYVLTRCNVVIAPTAQVIDVIKRYKVKKETFLLPTGIDPKYLTFSPEQKEVFRRKMIELHPSLAGKRILLFAGRLTREKNVAFLLNLLPAVFEKHDDAVLLIAGNGPCHDELMRLSAARGIRERCVFTGYLDRTDLGLAYAMSYMLVFPSLTETQGLVTIEAMYSGLPVVAIGSMGTLMVMNGDNGGFMVKNDAGEFAARVLELLEDGDLYARKAFEAKLHAGAWLIDSMALKLLDIYRHTIERYGRASNPSDSPSHS